MKKHKLLMPVMAVMIVCLVCGCTPCASVEPQETEEVDIATLFERQPIYVDGVNNTRDIGGYRTEDGMHSVRTGMIFRGANLDHISADGIKTLVKTCRIRTQLDLREPEEAIGKTSLGISVQYVNISAAYYDQVFQQANYESLAEQIRIFAKEENYPIYFHCQIGRDRTGTLAFLINALLGVSEENLIADYQLSFYTEAGFAEYEGYTVEDMMPNIENMIFFLELYEGETLADRTENFLLIIGVTQAEIDAIRSIMLE